MNKNGTIPVFAVCDGEYFSFAVTAFLSVLGYTSHYWQALRKTPWFYRARAELILYEIEASVNSIWRDPKDNVLTAFFKLGIEFAAALIRRLIK